MNKNKYLGLIVKIVIVVAIIIGNQELNYKNVYATNEKQVRYKSFDIGSDIIFKGVGSSHSLYFNLDEHMLVKSAEANIVFNITQLVDDTKSATITFLLNDVPFLSTRLVHKPDEEDQEIKVSIPLRLMKKGSNEFKIIAYCRISEDLYKDDNNNANWLVINKSSNVLIMFNDKEVVNHISEFPYPFIKTNEVKESNTVIVIPDDCKERELTAAFILQAYLGRLYKDDDYKGTIVKYSNMSKDKDIIYIGGNNDLPQEIKSLYSDSQKDNYNEFSIIKRNKSPFNQNNTILSIVSDNEEMLMKAIRLLCNKELVSQLNVDTFKVSKDVKEETTNLESKIKLSFRYLPNINSKSFIFDLYSNPFIKDNKFNNTAIVVPDELTQDELDGLSRMVSYMGNDVEYNNGILKIIKSQSFSEEYHNMNLIIYGSPNNNKVIREVNNNLWFKYKDGFKEFESNEKLYLTSPYSGNIANFQFDVSSYNNKNAMLILTSPKSELNTKALKYLFSSKEVFKMTGDCILIDEYGNLKTFKFKKDQSGFDYDKIKMADKSVNMFMAFAGMFLVFSVVSAILYYLKNKRFNK